jgi:ribosomal protein S18 acetylase RimI-like enzyme
MIYSIAVAPEFQGRGLAKALLAHAEDFAGKKMLLELRLYTNKRMQRNVALYVSYGFAKSGERPHPSREGEVLIDMVKPVKKASLDAAVDLRSYGVRNHRMSSSAAWL